MTEHPVERIPQEIVPEQIVSILRRHAKTIFGGRGIDAAYLYGSVATGLVHPFSDVDIALLVSEEKAVMTPYDRLNFEIEIELAIEDICRIDCAEVRVINDAPLTFRGQVATEGIRLHSENEARRVAFEAQSWKEYFDYQPWERLMNETLRARSWERWVRDGKLAKSREDAWQS